MTAWPNTLLEPNLLTIPQMAPLPDSYWQQVATGRWPYRYWLPTDEPTTDGLDGVAIHALATPGPKTIVPGLPEALLPLAVNDQRVFAVASDGRIRYLDLEVDQWLTVGRDWDDLTSQLEWRSPQLSAPYTDQELAHALLVADNAALPPLFDALRERGDWETYTAWLAYWHKQPAAVAEIAFALDFLPLSPDQKARLH